MVWSKISGLGSHHACRFAGRAQRSSALTPGQTVVEVTSGNTGTGLAISCSVLGHPFVAVMSRGNSIERARMMESCGARVVLVDQDPRSVPGQVSGRDLALVDTRAEKLVREHGYFRVDQFALAANVEAHERGTAQEILRQASVGIDGFVDFVGSGGTFTGVARALKAARPDIVCMAVEPETAPFLARGPVTDPRHKIQGGGYSRELPLFDPQVCDGFLQVSDAQAIACARKLAREEGIFAGFSSGANFAGALQLLKRLDPGAVVVCLACDSGLKYLSTDLFDGGT